MKSIKVANRYAKALFSLAANDDELKNRYSILLKLIEVLKKYPIVFSFHIDKKIKVELIADALKKAQDPLLINFLKLVINKHRLDLLPMMVSFYKSLIDNKLNKQEALMTSAYPIEENEKNKLIKDWKNTYGKQLEITQKIDPSLMEGFILEVGDKRIDTSLEGKLEQLRTYLKEV